MIKVKVVGFNFVKLIFRTEGNIETGGERFSLWDTVGQPVFTMDNELHLLLNFYVSSICGHNKQ